MSAKRIDSQIFPNLSFIGLGANLDDPQMQIKSAVEVLSHHPECQLMQCSNLYLSRPMGPQDQNDYINAVVKITTALSAIALLDLCQQIETQFGRVRKAERWGPRTLDLDILIYNDESINSERLIVPHYDMKRRNFVLLPLYEIAPQIEFPDGLPLSQLVNQIDSQGIIKL